MMRGRAWTFVVVPGAMVEPEAERLFRRAHILGDRLRPCSRCWWEAGIYVRGAVERWRAENAR